MNYSDNYHWLRESFIRIQASDRAVRRLPHSENRRRVIEHLQAAEKALDALDREMFEADELVKGAGL